MILVAQQEMDLYVHLIVIVLHSLLLLVSVWMLIMTVSMILVVYYEQVLNVALIQHVRHFPQKIVNVSILTKMVYMTHVVPLVMAKLVVLIMVVLV